MGVSWVGRGAKKVGAGGRLTMGQSIVLADHRDMPGAMPGGRDGTVSLDDGDYERWAQLAS